MKKKEIKELLSRFDEVKIPDKYKILSFCGAEYKCGYTEKMRKSARRMNLVRVAVLSALIALLICFTAAFATSEQVQELFGYIKVRIFYGDGSYYDKIVGSYPLDGVQTSAQTQWHPDGIVQKPDYWKDRQKDVSGYTVEFIKAEENTITLHIVGGEEFKVYKNYVKLERLDISAKDAEWATVFERLMPVYSFDAGYATAPTTDVINGEGNFTTEIEKLSGIFADNKTEGYKYRITVKVCSPEGKMDEGDVTAIFEMNDFE